MRGRRAGASADIYLILLPPPLAVWSENAAFLHKKLCMANHYFMASGASWGGTSLRRLWMRFYVWKCCMAYSLAWLWLNLLSTFAPSRWYRLICAASHGVWKYIVTFCTFPTIFRLRRHQARAVEYPNPGGVEKISRRRDPRWRPFEHSKWRKSRQQRKNLHLDFISTSSRLPVWAGNGHYARLAWSIANFDPSKEFPRRIDDVYCFFIAAK